MLKRSFQILVAVLLALSAQFIFTTHAQAAPSALDKQYAVGGMVGTEVAGNFVIRVGDQGAIDLALGGGWNRGPHMYTHVQYLHRIPLGKWSAGELTMPIGIGLQFGLYPDGRNLIAGKHRCDRCSRDRDDWDGRYRYRWAWRYDVPWVGFRVPIGVAFAFAKAPVDVFAELGPGMYLAAIPDFNFTFTTGARYWF